MLIKIEICKLYSLYLFFVVKLLKNNYFCSAEDDQYVQEIIDWYE